MKEERLRELCLFSPKERWLQGEPPPVVCSYRGEGAEKMEPDSSQRYTVEGQEAVKMSWNMRNSDLIQ